MPLRERMRKAFGRKTSSDDLTPKRTRSQKENLYRIGEPMPQPKYPGRYNKHHQDMLRAFSFSGAFNRRKSDQTEVSPMGSKAVSRRNSGVARGQKSAGYQPRQVGPVVENAEGENAARNGTADKNPRLYERDPELQDPWKTATNDTATSNGTAHFTEHELSAAVKNTPAQAPMVSGLVQ